MKCACNPVGSLYVRWVVLAFAICTHSDAGIVVAMFVCSSKCRFTSGVGNRVHGRGYIGLGLGVEKDRGPAALVYCVDAARCVYGCGLDDWV